MTSSNSSQTILSTILLALPSTLIVLVLSFDHTNYLLDDALIYARYMRNALDGHGLVFNVGERWNGLTSPLYSYILLGCSYLAGEVLNTQRYLSAGALILAITIAGVLIQRGWSSTKLTALSFALLSASSVYFYSIFGMESFLYISLIFGSLLCYQEKRYTLLALLLSLLIITRGEGILLVAVLGFQHLRRGRPLPPLFLWLIPLVIATTQLITHYTLFDTFLPETLGAKIAQGTSGYWGGRFAFLKGVKMYTWYFGPNISILFALSALLSVYGLFLHRKNELTQSLVLYLCLLTVFYVSLGIPFYHWYYAPFIFSGYFFLSLGLEGITRAKGSHIFRLSKQIAYFAFIATITIYQFKYTSDFVNQKHRSPYKAIALWIKKHTAPDAKVAAVEVGTLGWYSERPMIDILGLTTPHNARYLAKRDLLAWTKHGKPDILVAHKPLWPQEQAVRMYRENGAKRITEGAPKGFQIITIKEAAKEQL